MSIIFHPHASEQFIRCECCLDNDCIPIVADALLAEDFNVRSYRQIWMAILKLYRSNFGVDAIILADAMIRAGFYDDVGGDDVLTDVVHSVYDLSDVAHIGDSIGIVRDLSDRRIGD
jgi:replicative DNA helicase